MSNILVSILVVSYNAENTILDTLESIKAQSYDPLELIVSDDCSIDNTSKIANTWIRKNADRFVHSEFISTPNNLGVCANCNLAHSKAKGIWVKSIAGDDILMPDCISDCMNYVQTHPEAEFVSSCMKEYDELFEESRVIRNKIGPSDLSVFEKTASEQLRIMAWSQFVWAPTMFYKLSLFNEIGGFNTSYGYEDHPFYMGILEAGHKIYYLDEVTVGYRFHKSSSHSANKLFNYNMTLKSKKFIREKCFKYYNWKQKFAVKCIWFQDDIRHTFHLEKETKLSKFIYRKYQAIFYKIASL